MRILILAPALLLATACGAPPPADSGKQLFTLQFEARAGQQPFTCQAEVTGIGTKSSKMKLLDFRLWLHDLQLINAQGEAVALELKTDFPTRTVRDDGYWQKANLALLDFEDATGSCQGTEPTRTVVVGHAPAGEYTGLRFKVGVPHELNHIDASTADYPLGIPGLAWQWTTGYRFVRLDVSTTGNERYFFHLGSSGCQLAADTGEVTCASPNRPAIELSGFNPATDVVVADVAAAFAGLDVDDPSKGSSCMSSGTTNALCPSFFSAFGLKYGSSPASAPTFFRAVSSGGEKL
jgi:uncharacterized repeat protein (TIGR04052 family)